MFVHIDQRWFEAKPIRGVVLGLLGVAMWVVLSGIMFREYRGFGKTPVVIDLKTVAAPPENHGQWVRVDEPLLVNCAFTTQQENNPPERWIFGRIDETFFVVGIEESDRHLLLVYHGDAHCDATYRRPLEGVLQEINSRRRTFLSGGGFTFPPQTNMQLEIGDGPASYRKLMAWSLIIPLASLLLIQRYGRKWRMQVKQGENLTTQLMRPYTPKAF